MRFFPRVFMLPEGANCRLPFDHHHSSPSQPLLATTANLSLMAWDSSRVRAPIRWLIFGLTMVVVVGTMGAAFAFSMVAICDGLNTIISSFLLALSSSLLHLLQVWSPATTRKNTFPGLRIALSVTLFTFFTIHILSVAFLLACQHQDICSKVPRLTTILLAVLGESFTRSWTWARCSWSKAKRIFIYATFLCKVAFFVLGTWYLFHDHVHFVWGLPVVPLLRHFILVTSATIKTSRTPSRINSFHRNFEIWAGVVAWLLLAAGSSAVLGFGLVGWWNPNIIFYVEFTLIQTVLSLAIARSIKGQNGAEESRHPIPWLLKEKKESRASVLSHSSWGNTSLSGFSVSQLPAETAFGDVDLVELKRNDLDLESFSKFPHSTSMLTVQTEHGSKSVGKIQEEDFSLVSVLTLSTMNTMSSVTMVGDETEFRSAV